MKIGITDESEIGIHYGVCEHCQDKNWLHRQVLWLLRWKNGDCYGDLSRYGCKCKRCNTDEVQPAERGGQSNDEMIKRNAEYNELLNSILDE